MSHAEHSAMRRFYEEMKLRNLRLATIKSYGRTVRKFQEFLEPKGITAFTDRDVKRYLLQLSERGLCSSSINSYQMAIRGFSRWVLGRELKNVPIQRRHRKLPQVLTRREVEEIFRATKNEKYRTMLITAYSAGLRRCETRKLRVQDIDSDRKRLLIREGKGGDSRYALLSTRLLRCLRKYWKNYRPTTWLFPEKMNKDAPISGDMLSRIFRQARIRAGIEKPATLHSLRHSFATHLLETGTPLPHIKKLLGHRTLKSTMVYLKVIDTHSVPSPIEYLSEDALALGD